MSKTKTGLTWHADLRGEDGNAWVIMGVTRNAIKQTMGENWKEEARKYGERARSGDYENLLKVTREYITIEDYPSGFLVEDDDDDDE